MDRDRELLEKLYHAAERLDEGFITAITNSSEDISGMDGVTYDEIMDVFIEVAEYLGVE